MRAHWMDNEEPITADALTEEGLRYQRLDTAAAAFQAPLDELKESGGYVHQDEVVLRPDTPELDEICAKYEAEHLHTEDEVRFVVEGEGIFDIRSRGDRWMRVSVEAGDLVVVPKNRYHRFFLTDSKTIRCVRLFQDRSGWTPQYRAEEG